jgi:nitroreductase
MNEIVAAILSRRSVRSFKADPVREDQLDTILKCGIYGPTGRNAQPLFFVALRDPAKKEELLKGLGVEKNYYGAPVILFVLERLEDRFTALDTGAAMENMLLAAESFGLSGCWIHSGTEAMNTSEGKALVKKVLGLKDEATVVETIALGYREGDKPAPKPRNMTGDKVI